jgi:DNA-binding NtrC family response regulator
MSRRIAIVEDEPVIRANYADVLKKQGYEVAAYAGRSEALGAFRIGLPDVALIDVLLLTRSIGDSRQPLAGRYLAMSRSVFLSASALIVAWVWLISLLEC